MKTAFLTIATLLATAAITATPYAATAHNTPAGTEITASDDDDDLLTRNVEISDYTRIEASRTVNLIVEDRSDNKAVIKATEKVMPHVVVKVEGPTLVVTIDNLLRSINNESVTVYVPGNSNISAIDASSAASVVVQPEIKSSEFALKASSAANIEIAKSDVSTCSVDASSAAKIEGAIKADNCLIDLNSASDADLVLLAVNCTVAASSASNIELSGEAGDIEIKTSSAAKVDALELNARNVKAKASSGSTIRIACSKSIDADASSGGSIKYEAKGTLESQHRSSSSGGSIKEL